jgi:phosphatidylserine/phosphatidylglycerophosphate/cardiolipin synthase-like enzyme
MRARPEQCDSGLKRLSENIQMQFINNGGALKTIAGFLTAEKDDIAIAVAFWGGDAQELLQIENWKAQRVRIVCDATSGACNPQTLQYLRTKFPGNVFANARLHSKVYWTPKKVVITSANASASGLSLEGSETYGNIEAGVMSSEPEILNAIKKWFDSILDLLRTVEVDDEVMKVARRMWKRRRIGRRIPDNIPTLRG